MSVGKGNKRISVFDRLGPGTDESSPSHRRYSSTDKHPNSSSQEKGRGHSYGAHGRMEDRDTPPSRDRKPRHRMDYSSDSKSLEDSRTSNPPPLKSSRDAPEVLKSVGVKLTKPGSGESDYESGEDGKRRKGYHGDKDKPHRGEHSTDVSEEDTSRRRGKDKVHSHSERPSSSTSHQRSPPPSEKQRSRKEGGNEHKKHKEEEVKTPSELGHKRKRDHFEDGHLHENKRARHGSRDRDSDHHHGNKESEQVYGSADKKWRQESSVSEVSSRKQQPSIARPSGERGRERERGGSKVHRHNSRERKRTEEKEQVRGTEGRTRNLDWAIVNSYTEKANSKLKYQCPVEVLKKFTPTAIFSGIVVSPSLAGPQRYRAISDLVKSRVQEDGEDSVLGCWVEALQGSKSITPHKTALEWDRTIAKSLGPCRRALTAADDYVLRRMLRKEQDRAFLSSAVRTANSCWATSQYEVALSLYNTLPIKPSGKPANRLHTSRVGTLVL